MEKTVFAVLAAALLLAGCVSSGVGNGDNNMTGGSSSVALAKTGDNVSVNYVGFLDGGKVFDTNIASEAAKAGIERPKEAFIPLNFTVGAGQMIEGFDKAVRGMAVGQKKTIHITPSEAYGERDENLVVDVPAEKLEEGGLNASVGLRVFASNGGTGVIIAVKNGTATIDFNHELAGKALNFNVTLMSIG
ncbi:MAG: peptidylprolyl isomerase [Candidatus Micrarchaeota archaeon]